MDAANGPPLDGVLRFWERLGGTAVEAEAWWRSWESHGWSGKSGPIRNWQGLARTEIGRLNAELAAESEQRRATAGKVEAQRQIEELEARNRAERLATVRSALEADDVVWAEVQAEAVRRIPDMVKQKPEGAVYRASLAAYVQEIVIERAGLSAKGE